MKKLLLLLANILLPMMASADAIEIDGIYYNLIPNANVAEVTTNPNKYTGTVVVPESVTYEGTDYSVTSIGDYAFQWCNGMISVILPNNVTSIGEVAFDGCSSLTTVIFGNGLKTIGTNAFQGCSCLTSATIPNSVTSIGNRAFWGCSGLTFVIIPYSVISIGKEAFQGCSSLTSLIIPNSVTNIGMNAFEGCSGLTSVTIPNSITCIEGGTFSNCSGLTYVTIPNSVTCIKDGEISGHHNLVSYYRGAFSGCSSLTTISIPNSVTSIGNGAFQGCIGLNTVNIPNSVITIGNGVFDGCNGLTSVTIPNSVTNIGTGAFYGCVKLTSITIPNSVVSMGDRTFEGCSNLTSMTIPNCVTSIGYRLFYGCSSLTSLTIPNSVTSIGVSAFQGCSGLSSIVIPNSVNTLGESAFENCVTMETMNLPDGLQIIRKATFKGCNSLKSITIPSTVEFIYQEAFANCDGLENVKAKPGIPPFLYDNSFTNFSVSLEVPKGCKEDYQNAQGWKNFTNISESEKGYYKLIYMVDNEEYKSYKIEEETPITPEPAPIKEGYSFSGWSEIPETMPAHDVTVTGTFTINKYKLIYTVDGEEYNSYELDYGATITPEPAPTKEGYTFSGWSEIPETMPAHDVTVTGTFSINSYKLTYMIDDKVYKETMYEYGATITPEPQPEGDYATFEWKDLPQTMPAHDVIVYASYTSGIIEVLMTTQRNIRIYSPNGKKLDKLQKGLNIVVLDDGTVKKVVVK